MGSIGVNMSVTRDSRGALQAPARAGEVTRGGFTHGGWGQGYHEDLAVQDAPRSASLARFRDRVGAAARARQH